jgi:molecular chaperone GrpE
MSGKKKIKIDVGEEATDPEILEKETDVKSEGKTDPDGAIEELEQKLADAEGEAKESYERFLRASAELDNFKKRKEKEIADLRKFANESLLKELLSVADNLERAIEMPQSEGGEKQIVAGVDLTLKELLKVFQKFGVQPIDAMGEAFDPAFHQAMMQQEVTDQPDNIVIQELQKGYTIHDRLLRPAMVVVSKTNNNESVEENAGNTEKNEEQND